MPQGWRPFSALVPGVVRVARASMPLCGLLDPESRLISEPSALAMAFAPPSISPVSYTQLDVYKRQT